MYDSQKLIYLKINHKKRKIKSQQNRTELSQGDAPKGKADHDIVYVEYDIKAKRIKQASRKMYLNKRADMVCLKSQQKVLNVITNAPSPVNRVKGMPPKAKLIMILYMLSMTLRQKE